MTRTGWRIVRAPHAATAFDGEGARRYGGRWNCQGIPMVYAAASLSLAALELLVHLEASYLMDDFMCISIQFDESLYRRLDPTELPTKWTTYPGLYFTQQLGTAWFNSGDSAILIVPSAVVPLETNYLINPLHPDFKKIQIDDPREFQYDPRLAK